MNWVENIVRCNGCSFRRWNDNGYIECFLTGGQVINMDKCPLRRVTGGMELCNDCSLKVAVIEGDGIEWRLTDFCKLVGKRLTSVTECLKGDKNASHLRNNILRQLDLAPVCQDLS